MQLVHSLCLKSQYGILFGGGDTYERKYDAAQLSILRNLE